MCHSCAVIRTVLLCQLYLSFGNTYYKKMLTRTLFLFVCLGCTSAQRPSFAGTKPIGFPELYDKPATEGLGNRFGESNGTTERLPIEAQGDRDLIDRLSKLPVDQQPFWFINWQALEEHRRNPQSYPQKPNIFIESQNGNTASNFGSSQNNINTMSSTNIASTTNEPVKTNQPNLFNRNGIPTKGAEFTDKAPIDKNTKVTSKPHTTSPIKKVHSKPVHVSDASFSSEDYYDFENDRDELYIIKSLKPEKKL